MKISSMTKPMLAAFGVGVVIHIDDETNKSTTGIFDNPASLTDVPSGGFVADSKPTLFLCDGDTTKISTRTQLTVNSKRWIVVQPPESDGGGLTKLTLGAHDGKQHRKSTISY